MRMIFDNLPKGAGPRDAEKKLRGPVASISSMASDSTGIREVATGRLPKPGKWRNGTRALRSAPGSDNVSISSSVA